MFTVASCPNDGQVQKHCIEFIEKMSMFMQHKLQYLLTKDLPVDEGYDLNENLNVVVIS